MTTLREAAQQALEALEMLAQPTKTNSETPRYKAHKAAITALRAALAQEEQEPVAMCRTWHKGSDQHAELLDWTDALETLPDGEHSLYSAPPRRETEQEPVAYTTGLIWRPRQSELVLKVTRSKQERYGFTVPLWTSPPRREWRGLTMQEINALPEVGGRMWNMGSAVSVLRAIRAVEAKLKERNT